jgi:hypothetical protein
MVSNPVAVLSWAYSVMIREWRVMDARILQIRWYLRSGRKGGTRSLIFKAIQGDNELYE